MQRSMPLFLAIALLLSCGKKEESDVLHFANSDMYPIYTAQGATDPTWSPDGNTIVFVYRNDLWSISPDGGEPTQVTTLPGAELSPNWSSYASDQTLVFANTTGPNDYTIYTLKPGSEPQEVQKFSGQVTSTSWSRDGSKIVFIQMNKKGIYTIPVEGGEATLIPNDDGWETVEVAQCSPARDVVIYVDQHDNHPRLNSISLEGGKPTNIMTFTDGVEHPFAVAESYDGSTIAYTTWFINSWKKDLLIIPSTGGAEVPITNLQADGLQPNNPTWAPDGTRLAIQLSNGLYMIKLKLK